MNRPKAEEAYLNIAIPVGAILVWLPLGIFVALLALPWAVWRWFG